MYSMKKTAVSSPITNLTLIESRVIMLLGDIHCLLSDGRQASRALSCLVSLQVGDLVLVKQTEESCHVLHVLERSSVSQATVLSIPATDAAEAITLRAPQIDLYALQKISLISAYDIDVTAVAGSLSFNARHLFAIVQETLVQQARDFVGKAGQYLLDVRHLLKIHGQDVLITAERDIKADAERISMG